MAQGMKRNRTQHKRGMRLEFLIIDSMPATIQGSQLDCKGGVTCGNVPAGDRTRLPKSAISQALLYVLIASQRDFIDLTSEVQLDSVGAL